MGKAAQVTNPAGNDRQLAMDYLLGRIPEEELPSVRERLFTDATFFDEVLDAENDLLDDYATDSLSPEDRAAMEIHLLTTPSQIARLKTAGVLASRAQWLRARRPSRFTTTLLIAAMISLAIAVGWMTKENSRLRSELNVAQNPPASAPARTPSTAPVKVPEVFTFVLPATITRSSDRPVEIQVPPTAQMLHMRIPVNPAEPYTNFEVILRSAGGDAIWTMRNLPRSTERGASTVDLWIPSSSLPPAGYELQISGQRERPQAPEPIGFAYFTLTRE